jgi:chorismate synthase
MRGNHFGKMLSITSFGESHGPAIGCIVDGVPPGLEFSISDLQTMLDRRAPGRVRGTTARKEPDQAEILSGVFENKTLGTPIAVIVRNQAQRSEDYDALKDDYRPGHADRTTMLKYGIRDHRGGGRSSGRETIARVVGGYFASLILPKIVVKAYVSKMGPFEYGSVSKIDKHTDFGPYGFPDSQQNDAIEKYLVGLKKDGDSIGGRVCCIVDHCPVGLGEPAFDKLKADLGKALLSIGAVVGYSFGLGDDMALRPGKEISQKKENFGGMEGGISNGDRLVMTVTFKPTSTVGSKAQLGRHDPCIIPRAIPVVESMVLLVLADHYLRQQAYQSWLSSHGRIEV